MYVCVCVRAHVRVHTYNGERNTEKERQRIREYASTHVYDIQNKLIELQVYFPHLVNCS